jgi:FMN phosphatase YigB (HAD superfamily)
VVRGLLFDLDGTLLDIDGDAFLERYLEALAPHLCPDMDGEAFRAKVMAAALPLLTAERLPASVGDTFRAALAERLGLSRAEVAAGQARLDAHLSCLGPIPHARVPLAGACVDAAMAAGLACAVATTPIYRPPVIRRRLSWAGLAKRPWTLVTTSENMSACKPSPGYFREAAAKLGLPPAECVMVGDDPYQDGPAAEAGMRFHLIPPGGTPAAQLAWTSLLDEIREVSRGRRRTWPV